MKYFLKNQFKKMLFLTVCTMSLLVVSCSSDDDGPGEPPVGNAPPIEIDCDLFYEDFILTKNPDAPVDYIIKCHAVVKGKLTIEPGVVIHFDKDARIRFQTSGSIHAVGTADKPIIMTGTESHPGWWEGLLFLSGDNANIMDHVEVSYSGGQYYNGHAHASVVVYSGGALTMTNSTISHSEETGFEARYGTSTYVKLENNTFTNNVQPIIMHFRNAHKLSATNDYSGNELDRVLLIPDAGAIVEHVTWQNINVPYRTMGNIGIGDGGSLTLEPGVELEMTPDSRIKNFEGGLSIVGTQQLPIIIRGEYSGPGSWKDIWIKGTHPLNEIGFAKISDAGEDPDNNKGAVFLGYSAKLNIHDTEFKDLAACGVYGLLHVNQGSNPNYSSSNLTFINTACDEVFEESRP